MKFLIAVAARRRIKKQRAKSESAQSTSDPQAENQAKGEGEDVESSIGVENHQTGAKSAGEGSQAPGETKNAKMARQDGRRKREGPIRKLMHGMVDKSTKAQDS